MPERWTERSCSGDHYPMRPAHLLCRAESGRPWYLGRTGAFLYAFDLLELDGADLRREPIEVRKATLASILRKSRPGVRLNEHLEHPDGITVFQHACKVALEGIVSKRLGSRYRSGRSPDWLKFKNPAAPAVKREAEGDWGR
jgi:bifunctional non-homologous end joining protein LigD